MKKFIVIILALVYIISSIGVVVNMHYCMSKIAGWDLGNTESKMCAKCGMHKYDKKGKGCCNDEQTFFKSSIDQKITETCLEIKIPIDLTLPASFAGISINVFPVLIENKSIAHDPPLKQGVPIYILNCVYRI
ncbi:hypothetical protein LK994_14445 [Ferruginibacter lapsinanis]|uniref:HYC_CC_PP family protein n=1 Tax=Ferruginibacter lapsinanis TaxID=563172 RepID=UPI001E5D5715|nr:hypothetical protein [Ferruginibacter lapsinanis]UEG49837.1 hypothetical protein LK994_14445 [Ferruginibacter lapsinanis]